MRSVMSICFWSIALGVSEGVNEFRYYPSKFGCETAVSLLIFNLLSKLLNLVVWNFLRKVNTEVGEVYILVAPDNK